MCDREEAADWHCVEKVKVLMAVIETAEEERALITSLWSTLTMCYWADAILGHFVIKLEQQTVI